MPRASVEKDLKNEGVYKEVVGNILENARSSQQGDETRKREAAELKKAKELGIA